MKTPDPAAAFREVGPRAEANLERAVATILEAHPDVKVVIITVPDIRDLPEFRVPLQHRPLAPRLCRCRHRHHPAVQRPDPGPRGA